jgi:hypothetical protein
LRYVVVVCIGRFRLSGFTPCMIQASSWSSIFAPAENWPTARAWAVAFHEAQNAPRMTILLVPDPQNKK